MTEFELIAHLAQSLPTNPSVVIGAGDDCAALDLGIPGTLLLFKTDAMVEGVHFGLDMDPEKIGHKALGRCLSDIAAMGGRPTHALITVGLPPGFSVNFIESVYAGMNALANRYSVAIVGGETTCNPDRFFFSVSVLGTVQKVRCIPRSGARVGDALFVTGTLGGSLSGKHLDFEPRLNEAEWLTSQFEIHAMVDVSDGLAGDLRHLTTSSCVGAELLGSAIPISRAAREAARVGTNGAPSEPPTRSPKTPLAAALTDGEDFELVFALASRDAVRLLDAWKAKFPTVPLHCIGKIVSDPGIRIRDQRGVRPVTEHGYVHFE